MRPLLTFIVALGAMTPAEVFACTLCHSPQATLIRARLLQPDLWFNVCAIALPIALLASIVAVVHFDPVGRQIP